MICSQGLTVLRNMLTNDSCHLSLLTTMMDDIGHPGVHYRASLKFPIEQVSSSCM